MSKDIYDQFRASQERLAVQRAEQRAEQEARRLREIHEEEERWRLVEETRLRESAEKDLKQRAEREAKIIRAREKIRLVTPRLSEILQAIKDNDPTIKSSKIKGVKFTSQLTELESGELKAEDLLQLYWGESWSSPQSEPKSSELRYRLMKRFNGGSRIFDGPAIEDFSLVTLLIDEAEISVFGSEKSSLTLDKFTKDESSIMPYLANAVSNPIRRYLRKYFSGGYHYGGIGIFGRYRDLALGPTDINGVAWSGTEVDNIGRRSFWSADGEVDTSDA